MAPLHALAFRTCPGSSGMRVLDIGCGTGNLLALYAEAGCEAYGIDASPAMLEQARRRLGEEARLELGDGTGLPYPDASFDIVLITSVLHELASEQRRAVVGEAGRMVRPEGSVLIVDYVPGLIHHPKGWPTRALSLAAERLAGRTHFRGYLSFMRAGGVPAIAADGPLAIESERIVGGGNLGVYVLRPT
jgi:ubiquinone/menaquinone biosynthesis C-methylase UbiE